MPKLTGVPGQYTTHPQYVVPSRKAAAAIAAIADASYLGRVLSLAPPEVAPDGTVQEDDYTLLREIYERKTMLEGEQSRIRALHARWDNLYAPQAVTTGGPDHWPEDKTARAAGRVHVSDNVYPAYVDIPAHLMAEEPIINYVPSGVTPDEREAAGRRERLFFEWWALNDFTTLLEETGMVRGLYGISYWKARWDALGKFPKVDLIDQPANLYIGWGNSDYSRMDWAVYVYGLSPEAIAEDFGLAVSSIKDRTGTYVPLTYGGDHADPLGTVAQEVSRSIPQRSDYERLQVEVYDYWYKRPAASKPEIWNCIYVGNTKIENTRHSELDDLPYIAIPNGKIPGQPWGKSEFYDVEQILREKDERLSAAGQMIHSVVGGQMWQLVGPETEVDQVPPGMIPKPNKLVSPGPNARIEPIQPVVLQFALEDYIKRLDREAATITGLNDLLLGLAPGQVLSSSKAISALTANYVGRIGLKRKQLYRAIHQVWAMAAAIWEDKDADIKELIDGNYRIEIKAPDLTPRGELEKSQQAINLVQNRLWSMERAMDQTGVEDPVEEKAVIREEQTDASLQPAAVQTQVGLMATLAQFGQPPTPEQTQNAARTLNRPAAGGQSLNAPENQGQPPPEAQAANAPGSPLAQTLIQEGEGRSRIIAQTPVEV